MGTLHDELRTSVLCNEERVLCEAEETADVNITVEYKRLYVCSAEQSRGEQSRAEHSTAQHSRAEQWGLSQRHGENLIRARKARTPQKCNALRDIS